MQVANSCTILYGPGLTRSDISPPLPHPKNKESLLRRRLGGKYMEACAGYIGEAQFERTTGGLATRV